ncbi:MAG: bifunctional phosphopantothenoylcysteine decarboxylase/phosphopantothenate--cysteine ligase CoaBC [Armatimonadota bacterium]
MSEQQEHVSNSVGSELSEAVAVARPLGDVLDGRRIILGVTGGIAAYKSCGLVTRLRERGATVRVVMTEGATWFVHETTFAALSGNEVGIKMFGAELGDELQHIRLQDFGEVMLVAPTTANCLAKVAHGICDDLLTTSVVAATYPVIFAPAMNYQMWANPIVQENVAKLRDAGYGIVMPEHGRLASGAIGTGRLAGEEALIGAVEIALLGGLPQQDLLGKKIVVSAGPTREPLDPVRFISNGSTGRQGYAIAAEAQQRGAAVTLVSGPVEIKAPPGVALVCVQTNAQMKQAVLAAVRGADMFISAAAPADFRPAEVADTKIKKADLAEGLDLHLEKTDDILLAVGRQARPPVLVGFAAETGRALEKGAGKLTAKDLDLLVVNDLSEEGCGFGTDTNRVVILKRNGQRRILPLMSKQAVAAALFDEIRNNH